MLMMRSLPLTTLSGLLVYTECLFYHCPEHGISRPMSQQMQAFLYNKAALLRHHKRDTGHRNVFVLTLEPLPCVIFIKLVF